MQRHGGQTSLDLDAIEWDAGVRPYNTGRDVSQGDPDLAPDDYGCYAAPKGADELSPSYTTAERWGAVHTPSKTTIVLGKLKRAAQMHIALTRSGWHDTFQWPWTIQTIRSSPAIRATVIKGFILSAAVTTAVYVFEMALIPRHLFDTAAKKPHPWANTFYPVLGFCYFAASSWTWNTVQAANRTHGRAAIDSLPPNRTEAWYTRKALCAHAYQIYLPVYFFLLSSLLSALKVWAPPIPGLATTLSAFNFSLACFVDGFYCFELAWRARGWGLERRAAAAEQRWSYLVAFGVPSTLISYFHPSGLLNMMLFMLIFPFYALLALAADLKPRASVPRDMRVPVMYPIVVVHRLLTRSGRGSDGRRASRWAPVRSSLSAPFAALGRGGAARVVGRIWSGDAAFIAKPSGHSSPYSGAATYAANIRMYGVPPARASTAPTVPRWTSSPLGTPIGTPRWSASPAPPLSTPSTPPCSHTTAYGPHPATSLGPRQPTRSATDSLAIPEQPLPPAAGTAAPPSPSPGLSRRTGSVVVPI